MDALEFLKERKRMCDSYKDCKGCPFDDSKCVIDSTLSDDDCERFAATVEQWSKEHPRKTRQSVFLEQWATAKIDKSGCLDVCPYLVSSTHRDQNGFCKGAVVKNCYDCRREFWMQEVE
jgi:hypothetical protein